MCFLNNPNDRDRDRVGQNAICRQMLRYLLHDTIRRC